MDKIRKTPSDCPGPPASPDVREQQGNPALRADRQGIHATDAVMDPDKPVFGRCVDLLIQWGEIHLVNPDDTPSLKKAEAGWESTKALAKFDPGLEKLKAEVNNSLDLLHGPATVDIGDGRKDGIMAALRILDLTVFLAEAIEYFPGSEQIPETSRQNAESLLQYVTIDRELSYPRLIPLNSRRVEILKKIPENARWLFPWYTVWSEIPEDFADALSDWRGRFSPERLRSAVPDKDLAGALLADVISDSALLAGIKKDARLFGTLADVGENSLALRIFAMRERHAGDPEREAGAQKALESLAANAVVSPETGTGRLERLFLTAFCALGLDKKKRIEIFEYTVKAIGRFPESNHDIFGHIRSWETGEIGENRFVEKIRRRWESALLGEIAEGPGGLEAAVDRALKEECPATPKPRPADSGKPAKPFFGTVFRIFPVKAFATVSAVLLAVLIASHFHDFPIFTGTGPGRPEKAKPVPVSPGKPVEKPLPEILLDELHVGRLPDEETPGKRTDPFVPLIRQDTDDKRLAKRKEIPAVPLARIELGEFRLVAIILYPGRNRALLEESSGKGHIVEKGSYIGRDRRVAEILKDRIVIKEKIEDAFGNMSVSRTEMRLPNNW